MKKTWKCVKTALLLTAVAVSLINRETFVEASADVVNGLRAVHVGTTRRSCPTKTAASTEVSY